MPNDVINTITIGNTTYDIGGSGSGHTIEKSDGTDMTQRANLQFVDATVTDDSTNDRTKIENVKTITNESELDDLPDGIYIGPTDEGIPFDAGDIPYDNTDSGLSSDNIQDAIDEIAGVTGGHIIEKSDGTDMTNRINLQFIDSQITDDSTNNRTKVENVKVISSESELANLPDGMYLGNYDEVDEITADDISYDNTTSGLTSTNVNDAIDEVASDLDDNISAKINSSLVTTTTVGGVAQGTTYLIDTPLETIIDDILAPDNRSNLCIQTGYEWSSSTDTLVSYYYYANCMIATTIYDGHPASLRTVDNVTYYPLKIKNNIDNVIITPANDSYIIVNVGIADGNGYKRVAEYGTDTDWKTTATNVNVSALRATYGVDDFYIIAKVAKSDWSTVSDIEPLRPTITYVSAISPNIPPVPTSQGLYDLECNINESGNSQLLWKQNISDIKNELSTESSEVEGNPLSFTTLSAQSAESTLIDLEPIQDLHGYNKPWVGGAGKNKLPLIINDIKSVNTAGTWSGNVYTFGSSTFTILTDSDGNVTGIKVDGSANVDFAIPIGFDANGMIISGCPANGSDTTYYVVAGTESSRSATDYGNGSIMNGTSTRVVLRLRSTYTANNLVFYPMVRLSTETDATFAPYTNISSISGRTEANLVGCGLNICSGIEAGTWTGSTQEKSTQTNRARGKDIIKIKPSTTYTISVTALSNKTIHAIYCTYNGIGSGTLITNSQWSGLPITFTTESNAEYVTLTFRTSDNIDDPMDYITNVQLEEGSSATDYSPYTKSNDITVQFGQTVYGGTLDVKKGVLIVKEIKEVYNGSVDENWVTSDEYGNKYLAIASPSSCRKQQTIISNMFKGTYNHRSLLNNGECSVGTDYVWLYCRYDEQPSLSDWKTYLSSNNMHVCYELATPIEIQLPPHTVNLLKGANYISTDGDKITLTYRTGEVATLKDIKDSLESSKPVYSTAETVIGTYLNKPLYSKTYQVQFSSSDSYYFDVPSEMDIKFVLGGVYSTRFDFIPFGYGDSGGNMVQCYRYSETQFRIQNTYYASKIYCDVTLQYTKSTD